MSECKAVRHRPTVHSYRRYGCRCPDTVEETAAKRAQWRASQKERGYVDPKRAARITDRELVDEIAIARALRGESVRLTLKERGLVVRKLTAEGLSARAIAERLGVCRRQVHRYRMGRIKAAAA